MYTWAVYLLSVSCIVYLQAHSLTDERVWVCAGIALAACVWEGSYLWEEVYGGKGDSEWLSP